MTLRIAFVHVPMAAAVVPERRAYWQAFDVRYHSVHPALRHMKKPRWELPHWMTWLAGVLVRDGFDDLHVVDLTWVSTGLSTVNEAEATAIIRNVPADVYLFSPMTPNLTLGKRIVELVKAVWPQSTTVFGGVVATPLHEEIAADPNIDYVVVGRGEVALTALLRALERGGEGVEKLGSVTYRRGGEVVPSPWQYPALQARDIALPKIDLFPPETGEELRYLRQVYGLGCPYACSFCTIQTIRQKQTFFPVDRVVDEIHAYRRHYGEHHYVYFGDETFALDVPRFRELADALAADGTIHYDCQTRLRCLASAQTRALLKRSGCVWVEVGLETMSQTSQNIHKQRQKISETEDILSRTRDDGISTCAYMVNGFPDQTLDDMRASMDWVCDLLERGLLQASYLSTLVPYPGSDLYADPERFGIRLLHKDYALYNEDLAPVYDTAHWKSDEAYAVFLEGLEMIARTIGDELPLVGTQESGYGEFWATAHI